MQVDDQHPVELFFRDLGYQVWVIPYVSRKFGRPRLTAIAKKTKTGRRCQAWGDDLDGVLFALWRRWEAQTV